MPDTNANANANALVWDKVGERQYETGTDHGVLYVYDSTNQQYGTGVAWSGLIGVDEKPSGAEPNNKYADNIKYLVLRSAEDFKAAISAYTYPDEFEECDGSAELAPGLFVGQQTRKTFGFSYRTKLGNDVDGDSAGYILHLVYGATASPSQRSYKTINENPEPIEFSWEVETTPVAVTGKKPTAHIRINSLKADSTKLAALEAILYGGESAPRLPLPDEVKTKLAV